MDNEFQLYSEYSSTYTNTPSIFDDSYSTNMDYGSTDFQFDAMDSDLASFDPNASDWGMNDTIGAIQGVSTSIELIGSTNADNQDAAAHRKQAELDRARAEEITRRADISMQQVSTASRAIVSSQKTALVSRGVSASGNQAAMAASDSINEAIKEQVNIDTAAKYDRDMALASAQSHEDQADNLDSSMFGTIMSIGVGVGVTIYTGGNVAAGSAAAKGTKAIVG